MRKATLTLFIGREQVGAAMKDLDAMGAKGEEAGKRIKDSMSATERQVLKTADAMRRMQEQSRANAMASMISASDPFQKQTKSLTDAAEAAGKHHLALGRVNLALEGLASEALGANAKLGSLSSKFLEFGVGGVVTGVVLAALALLATAWEKVTEKARTAGEEQKKAMDRLADLAKKQRQGPLGDTPDDLAIAWKKALAATADVRRLEALSVGGLTGTSASTKAKVVAAARVRQKEALDAIEAGGREIAAKQQEIDEEAARKAAEKNDEDLRQLIEHMKAKEDVLERFQRQQKEFEENDKNLTGFGIGFANTRAANPNGNAIPVFASLTAVAERAKSAVTDAAHTAQVTRETMEADAKRAAIRNIAIQSGLNLLGTIGGPTGAMVSNTGSAALSGFAAGGPWGAAIAGLASFTTGLLGMRKAAAEATAEHERLENAYKGNIVAIRVMLGQASPLEKQLYDLRTQFDELRKQAEQLGKSGAAERIEELNRLEAQRAVQLAQQAAAEEKFNAQDLQARLLAAQGREDEASALSFATQQQRAYAAAVDAGKSAIELANLAEVQRAETIARTIEKLQTQISAYSATIDGLKSFKDALLLSDTGGLSPTAKLEEAKRQYDEILKAAQAGDQGAAGRLPAAAQTYLDLARTVYGSSQQFQAILDQVLRDTDATIKYYDDARTVAQQQLDELKKILAEIRLQTDVIHDPTVYRPRDDQPPDETDPTKFVPGSGGGSSGNNIVAAGLVALISEVQTLQADVRANTRVTRDGLEAVAL